MAIHPMLPIDKDGKIAFDLDAMAKAANRSALEHPGLGKFHDVPVELPVNFIRVEADGNGGGPETFKYSSIRNEIDWDSIDHQRMLVLHVIAKWRKQAQRWWPYLALATAGTIGIAIGLAAHYMAYR